MPFGVEEAKLYGVLADARPRRGPQSSSAAAGPADRRDCRGRPPAPADHEPGRLRRHRGRWSTSCRSAAPADATPRTPLPPRARCTAREDRGNRAEWAAACCRAVATWGGLLRQAAEVGLRLVTQAARKTAQAGAGTAPAGTPHAAARAGRATRPPAPLHRRRAHRPGPRPRPPRRLRARPRRRRRPGRDRLDLGAVRGGRRPRQGPAGAGRRPGGPRPRRADAVQPVRARGRPELGRHRLRRVGRAGPAVVRPAGPGDRGRRARDPPRGRGARRAPVRAGGASALRSGYGWS